MCFIRAPQKDMRPVMPACYNGSNTNQQSITEADITDQTIQQTGPSTPTVSAAPAASVINKDVINEELLDFLEQCPTPYHTADTIRKILLDNGYKELRESSHWNLKRGGHYFVLRGGSSIIAFRVPYSVPAGFMIAASHSDSPALKIKVNPEMKGSGYIRLNVEKYGGRLQLSMHSSYETAGTKDTAYLVRAAETFFSSTLRSMGNGNYELYQETSPVSMSEVREI